MQGQEIAGYSKMVLFSYSTQHLKYSARIRFFYALMGRRGTQGILQRTETIRIGRCVLMVDEKQAGEVEDFLKYWECEYIARPMYVENSHQVTNK